MKVLQGYRISSERHQSINQRCQQHTTALLCQGQLQIKDLIPNVEEHAFWPRFTSSVPQVIKEDSGRESEYEFIRSYLVRASTELGVTTLVATKEGQDRRSNEQISESPWRPSGLVDCDDQPGACTAPSKVAELRISDGEIPHIDIPPLRETFSCRMSTH